MTVGAGAAGVGMETRYGLNQAWNSRFRLCASLDQEGQRVPAGVLPCVRRSGTATRARTATARTRRRSGRTCTTTALWLQLLGEVEPAAVLGLLSCDPVRAGPGALLGQSMLTTDEIHMARNCRFGVAGSVAQVEVLVVSAASGAALAGVAATSVPSRAATSPAAPSRAAFMRCVPSLGLPCDARGAAARFADGYLPLVGNFHSRAVTARVRG